MNNQYYGNDENQFQLQALYEENEKLQMTNTDLVERHRQTQNAYTNARIYAAKAGRELQTVHQELVQALKYKDEYEKEQRINQSLRPEIQKQQKLIESLQTENQRLRAAASSQNSQHSTSLRLSSPAMTAPPKRIPEISSTTMLPPAAPHQQARPVPARRTILPAASSVQAPPTSNSVAKENIVFAAPSTNRILLRSSLRRRILPDTSFDNLQLQIPLQKENVRRATPSSNRILPQRSMALLADNSFVANDRHGSIIHDLASEDFHSNAELNHSTPVNRSPKNNNDEVKICDRSIPPPYYKSASPEYTDYGEAKSDASIIGEYDSDFSTVEEEKFLPPKRINKNDDGSDSDECPSTYRSILPMSRQ